MKNNSEKSINDSMRKLDEIKQISSQQPQFPTSNLNQEDIHLVPFFLIHIFLNYDCNYVKPKFLQESMRAKMLQSLDEIKEIKLMKLSFSLKAICVSHVGLVSFINLSFSLMVIEVEQLEMKSLWRIDCSLKRKLCMW